MLLVFLGERLQVRRGTIDLVRGQDRGLWGWAGLPPPPRAKHSAAPVYISLQLPRDLHFLFEYMNLFQNRNL